MTKREFLEELQSALAGEVSSEVMMDSYRYYDTFIEEAVRDGKTEEAVIEELGRPSLLARSIIAAHTGERFADVEYTEDGRARNIKRKAAPKKENSAKKSQRTFRFSVPTVLAQVILTLFLILLIIIVFFILKFGFWILATFGIPILLLLGIFYLILYFMR